MVDLDPAATDLEQPADLREPLIEVSENGPYRVRGGVPLRPVEIERSEEGDSIGTVEGDPIPAGRSYALCRCGQSSTKPFCDESHLSSGFDGTETADRTPRAERAREFRGRGIAFTDDFPLCIHAAYCENGETDVWDMVARTKDPEVRDDMRRMIGFCPSGRLALEPPAEPADPEVLLERNGPIWVRGAVRLRAADGTDYEVRGRMALCRCGRSSNKPFCDDTHSEIGFRDGSDGD